MKTVERVIFMKHLNVRLIESPLTGVRGSEISLLTMQPEPETMLYNARMKCYPRRKFTAA